MGKNEIEGYDVEETVEIKRPVFTGQSSITTGMHKAEKVNEQITDSTAFEIATLALMNQRVYKREAEELRTKLAHADAEITRLKADNARLATDLYEKAGAIDKLNWLIQKQAARMAKDGGK